MSLYAVVLICNAIANPCNEETSLREVIAVSPSPDEKSCFATADLMRGKVVHDVGEIVVVFCRVVPESNGSRFGGTKGAPAIGHVGPGIGGNAAHSGGKSR